MQASAPTQGRVAAGRVRWPGRVFPRVLQGVWWPGGCSDPAGYCLGQVRHPSVACGDTSPCRGGFWGGGRPGRLPCKGSWMRRRAQTEGCIAGWRRKYPARSGRALPRVLREVRRPGEHNSPEGYLQGQVRHPSAACGDTSPCRGGFWEVQQPAVPGFAARVPYAVGRAFTPAGEACGGGDMAGLCKTPSRKAHESTGSRRRTRSPALHCGRKRAATRKWPPF